MGDDNSAWLWWERRRLQYNIGLVIAGWLAFFLYAAAIELAPADSFNGEPPEITLFTILFQGIAYLFMMGLANVCYCLGMISEGLLKPEDRDTFRRRFYWLGFWFSFALPFSLPAFLCLSMSMRL